MSLLRCTGRSCAGLVRKVNEDALRMLRGENKALFLVADGLGGHSRGDVASALAAERLEEYWNQHAGEEDNFSAWTYGLRGCISQIHEELLTGYNQQEACGTTLCLLFICADRFAWFSVGDSRIYRFSGMQASLVTTDDVWENMQTTRDCYTPDEIAHDGRRGKLTQALGTQSSLDLHFAEGFADSSDRWLVCSDGLYKYCTAEEISYALKEAADAGGLEPAADHLLELVMRRGARDNVSLILVTAARNTERLF